MSDTLRQKIEAHLRATGWERTEREERPGGVIVRAGWRLAGIGVWTASLTDAAAQQMFREDDSQSGGGR